jgi:hypothetical protein
MTMHTTAPTARSRAPRASTAYCGIVRCTDVAVAAIGDLADGTQRLLLCQYHRDWTIGQIRRTEAKALATRRAEVLYDSLQPAEQYSRDGR